MSQTPASRGTSPRQSHRPLTQHAVKAETATAGSSFAVNLVGGKLQMRDFLSARFLRESRRPQFEDFLQRLETVISTVDKLDPASGSLPSSRVMEKLKALGAFGMLIPEEYGGLGFSFAEYVETLKLLENHQCGLSTLFTAHCCSGPAWIVLQYGSEEQKRKLLPALASGALGAISAGEPQYGLNLDHLQATVERAAEGTGYLLNGEAVWCSFPSLADLLLIVARHGDDNGVSVFWVESTREGVKQIHADKANTLLPAGSGFLSFQNVQLSTEHLIGAEGKGGDLLRRPWHLSQLSLCAGIVGNAQAILHRARTWVDQRRRQGIPLSRPELVARKMAEIAAATFAMEAVVDVTARLVDRGDCSSLETDLARLYMMCTHSRVINAAMEMRSEWAGDPIGTDGKSRESTAALEELLLNGRRQLTQGESREAVALHCGNEIFDIYRRSLEQGDTKLEPQQKGGTANTEIILLHPRWYAALWQNTLPHFADVSLERRLSRHLRFTERASRKLARQILYGFLRHSRQLEKQEAFLSRIAEIGAELFAMSAVLARAQQQFEEGNRHFMILAGFFCRSTRRKIVDHFGVLWTREDRLQRDLGECILDKQFRLLEGQPAGKGGRPSGSGFEIDSLLNDSLN